MSDLREPEWTAENMNRKRGDTTFQQCGWCEHATGGSCRYGCYLNTSCGLLKSYGPGRDVKWDTLCIVITLGREDLQDQIRSKEWEIKSCKRRIEQFESQIAVLREMDAPEKPPLPDNRANDFDLGSVVWVFHENKWNRGVVTHGYRSGDGCVSYVLDDYPETKGKPWGCGVSVPCVLKDWEYQYFVTHLDDFGVWLKMADREYNGKRIDTAAYADAMMRAGEERDA